MKFNFSHTLVGIGASAGGLKPLEDFFKNMPRDSGMSFIVVQHLSPDFKSLMDELLARHTELPIHKVSEDLEIEPNSIYLIPPEKNLSIANGKFVLTDKPPRGGLHFPIDDFFQSLAEQAGDRSIAIVLSGTGSDGSRGVKYIHEAGGLVAVQNPDSAAFDGMPRAAISSRIVDLIAEADEIPKNILEYQKNLGRASAEKPREDTEHSRALGRLFNFYRERNNLDFSSYKVKTINRRLERRMSMHPVQSLDAYLDLVEKYQEEADLLFRDLLVEVTSFFRDPKAYEILEKKVIPHMIERADTHSELRTWVCGCATGEEAYSIAILIRQGIENAGRADLTHKVFATDVHEGSLDIASLGQYPIHALNSVPEDLRIKYFVRSGKLCKVKRNLRQTVIFARNDVTKDPSFTRLDMICCRNVLIYLQPDVQKRVLSIFHYGLKNKGILFLGNSESAGDLGNEFDEVDRNWRLFQKKRDKRLPNPRPIAMNTTTHSTITNDRTGLASTAEELEDQILVTGAYDDLLTRYVPPSLLINERYELLHCFGDARKLLTIPEGKPTNNILKLLDKNLGVLIGTAVHRARTEQKPVVFNGVRVQTDDDLKSVFRVTVETYRKQNGDHYLISLEETDQHEVVESIVEEYDSFNFTDDRTDQLERELSYTRETLQATVEELESSNEELQATNEELVASNEELQSTNEELHSVNEELHSVNEELHTVNSEHKAKIDELTQVSSDMDHLLKGTRIGAIFLDESFNVRMFTPSISSIFDLMPQDLGKPINRINGRLESPQLLSDAADVLSTGTTKETEVRGPNQQTFLQRIQPYRRDDDINGVVLTFTDITEVKESENAKLMMANLAEISQELPDFAYAVSHDLKAPLRHINYYTELLENTINNNEPENSLRATRVLRNCATNLREMIDGLLTYSRINTLGKPMATVNFAEPIKSAIQELEAAIVANDAKITVQAEFPTVNGDFGQLKTLFFHILENSIKFRSEATPVIEISAKVEEGVVEIAIVDNGIGIGLSHMNQVFTIFKRLGFKEGLPGTGLGLAICRRIISRHKGRIWIDPTWTEPGTRVLVSLRKAE